MRRAALAAILVLLGTAAAPAHTVIPGIGGFPGGMLHPLLVPAHALTLIAIGLLTGRYATRMRLVVLATFAAAAVAAFALIAMAYSATQAEIAVLCLGATTGLLLAANIALPVSTASVLAASVSGAVMFDSVPPVLTISDTVVSLTGTVLSALLLIAATAFISGALPPHVRTVAVRIAGSWIAASAIMVLALRLAP